jgi:hypothetical protein
MTRDFASTLAAMMVIACKIATGLSLNIPSVVFLGFLRYSNNARNSMATAHGETQEGMCVIRF